MITQYTKEGNKEFKEFRTIQGMNDINKNVYFWDYVKEEFYIKGILKGFDCNCYEILLSTGEMKIYQTGYIKEEVLK